MATLYIQEYAKLAVDDMGKPVQIGQEPALASQTVAIGGASVQSAAFNARTKFVRLHTDVICSVKFGANPTATTSDAAARSRAVPPGGRYAAPATGPDQP